MAYQIKRNNRVVEDLELVNEKGEVEYTLHVDIDIDGFRSRYLEAVAAVNRINNLPADIPMEERENAAKDAINGLFYLVFGEEQTKDLLAFYEGKMYEALGQVIPFIQEVIHPAMIKAVADQKNRLKVLVGGKK